MTEFKKRNITSKTKRKLDWIKENKHMYIYDYDLRKALAKHFCLNENYAYKLIQVYYGEKENTSVDRPINKKEISDKKTINIGKCYFCGSENNLVEHHITYYPENICALCCSCHSKIHHLMKIQHETEIERSNLLKKRNYQYSKIKSILDEK